MKALEVRSIGKKFGSSEILKNIHMDVDIGERRAIIGPNGAGKTTLFNMISGILRPDAGKIIYFDRDITSFPTYQRARLGISRTFQKNNLFANLSLDQNLQLAMSGARATMDAEKLLKKFGLSDKTSTRVSELSHGVQRQVEIILALAQSPRLLLLDEPTAGLSQVESKQLTGVIGLLPRDITMILIEHDMDVVYSLADRISVLHQGEVICEGNKQLVRNDHRVREIYMGL